jgi:hypothetical protein
MTPLEVRKVYGSFGTALKPPWLQTMRDKPVKSQEEQLRES